MTRSKGRVGNSEQKQATLASSEAAEPIVLDQPVERLPVAEGSASLADRAERETTKPPRVDPLAEAAELARGGHLQDAASTYRDYLTRQPEDVSERRALAGVLEQRSDFVGALNEL